MVSEGTSGARILIVGDYPTADDLKLGRPFTGASGYHLDKALDSCGLSRSMCHLTFASTESPPFNPRTKDADLTLWLWRKKAAAPPGYAPHLGVLCAPPLLDAVAAT